MFITSISHACPSLVTWKPLRKSQVDNCHHKNLIGSLFIYLAILGSKDCFPPCTSKICTKTHWGHPRWAAAAGSAWESLWASPWWLVARGRSFSIGGWFAMGNSWNMKEYTMFQVLSLEIGEAEYSWIWNLDVISSRYPTHEFEPWKTTDCSFQSLSCRIYIYDI